MTDISAGRVRSYNDVGNYGFIVRDDGTDLFFRLVSVIGKLPPNLIGARATFRVRPGIKRPEAYDVSLTPPIPSSREEVQRLRDESILDRKYPLGCCPSFAARPISGPSVAQYYGTKQKIGEYDPLWKMQIFQGWGNYRD
jgi:cold shock CspA family protein